MNRIDRLNAILIHLQGKPRVTLDELELRFELSRRTIFRDIRALIESGVPIGGNAGEGYFIVEGYHLPPVVFNKQEAAALLLGAKFIEQHTDAQTAQTFDAAMYKVKAVLRYADKEFLDNLESRISIRPNPRAGQFPDSHIAELQTAVATHRVIHISYQSSHEQSTEREVEPLGMVFYSSHWHLIGFCRLRQDLRDFRSDRIVKMQMLPETFDPSSHPDYLSFLQDSLVGTDAKEVTIHVTKKAARLMGEQKFYQGFVEQQTIDEDVVEMKFVVAFDEYFARWLLMFGNEATVIAPLEMKEMVMSMIYELMAHYHISEKMKV